MSQPLRAYREAVRESELGTLGFAVGFIERDKSQGEHWFSRGVSASFYVSTVGFFSLVVDFLALRSYHLISASDGLSRLFDCSLGS